MDPNGASKFKTSVIVGKIPMWALYGRDIIKEMNQTTVYKWFL
jgi:hypothetical protein